MNILIDKEIKEVTVLILMKLNEVKMGIPVKVEGGCLSKIYRWREHFFWEIADKVDVEEKNKSCPICSVIRSPTCTPCNPNTRAHLYFSSTFYDLLHLFKSILTKGLHKMYFLASL